MSERTSSYAVTGTMRQFMEVYPFLRDETKRALLNFIDSQQHTSDSPLTYYFESEVDAKRMQRVVDTYSKRSSIPMASQSDNEGYVVDFVGPNPVACSCGAFTYGNGSHCKHMRSAYANNSLQSFERRRLGR